MTQFLQRTRFLKRPSFWKERFRKISSMATRWIVNRKLLFKGNRRFPSYLSPLFQSKSKCEAFYMWTSSIHTQILVHLHVDKTDFHMKGFAQGLALKQRRKATRNLLLHSHWLLWRRRLTLEKSAVIQFKRRLPVLRWENTVFKWALLQSCKACKPCDVTSADLAAREKGPLLMSKYQCCIRY